MSRGGAALLAATALLAAAPPAWASGRIDTAHAARDRHRADACILGAVVIYTDPYIGGRMRHREIVADIARMCAGPFARYADDLAFDAATATQRLTQIIEAALRGQFHDDRGRAMMRNAR